MESPSKVQQELQRDQPLSERAGCDSRLLPYGYVRLADGTLGTDVAAAVVVRQTLYLGYQHSAQAIAEMLNAAG